MARLHVLVLLSCAVLPLPGVAQVVSPPPLVPAPVGSQEAQEQPRGETFPRDWKAPQADEGMAGRLILGPLVGLVLGTVAALPGIVLMSDSFSCSTCGSDPEIIGGGLLSLVGFTLGGTLGVKLIGSLSGGEGRYLHTLIGAGAGFGAGLLGMMPLLETEGGWAIPLITFPIIGAVVGYEISHSNELERRAASPAVAVLPSVGVSPTGSLIAGLVGRF